MTSDALLDFVPMPAGEFLMGESPDDKFATETERPARRVCFRRRFAIGRFPVTSGDHGHFCEWVEDAWHASTRARRKTAWPGSKVTPPRGLRVIRGGAWDYLPRLLRSAWRDALPAPFRRDNVGFRIALTLTMPPCAS